MLLFDDQSFELFYKFLTSFCIAGVTEEAGAEAVMGEVGAEVVAMEEEAMEEDGAEEAVMVAMADTEVITTLLL